MSKDASKGKNKALRREKAKQRARRKAIIIVSILVLVIVAAAAVGINVRRHKNTNVLQEELYSYRGQTVQLFEDGTFFAGLAHNVSKDGTYTKTENNGITIVTFTVNGKAEIGQIINNSLHLPHEWIDSHGHGSVFPKNK